jgi:hypothetical protein
VMVAYDNDCGGGVFCDGPSCSVDSFYDGYTITKSIHFKDFTSPNKLKIML